ncbi:hypothetical protein D5S17_23680 [Pseudonocardiaceae bacterium YIM PH 21723]|nr:hypothetical protein D5S17_23680 [Pseudonocardiaceae bacterium YIM PH 21723]
MNQLEARYRTTLRALPRWYREQRADEMAEVFLASRNGDRVPLREKLSIWGLALRTRIGGVGAPPRQFAWGETVRLVALLTVVMQGLGGIVELIIESVQHSRLPLTLGYWQYSLATIGLPVLLLTLLGTRRYLSARLVGMLMLAPGLGYLLLRGMTWRDLLESLPLCVIVLCLFLGFHRDAPTPSLRPWRWFTAGAPALLALGIAFGVQALAELPMLYHVLALPTFPWNLVTETPIPMVGLLLIGLAPVSVALTALGRARLPRS